MTLRQFGQCCDRCSKEKSPYENPTFTDESVEEMTKFLLLSILDGIFSYTNRVNFDVIRAPRPFRRVRFNKKQANNVSRQSSGNTRTHDEDTGEVHSTGQTSDNVIQTHESVNCEACDKNNVCGKRRKRRRKKKVKETYAK